MSPTGKWVKYCKTHRRSCVAWVLSRFVPVWIRTMQVLFVLRFYHPDKTDKIDRLIHAPSSKMAVKISSVVKLFRITACCIHSFRIRSGHASNLSSFEYDEKNPPPLWIIWINNQFLDFSKEMKYPFSNWLKIRIWILAKKHTMR